MCEAYHSPLSTAGVKNAYSNTPPPLSAVCMAWYLIKHGGKFTYFVVLMDLPSSTFGKIKVIQKRDLDYRTSAWYVLRSVRLKCLVFLGHAVPTIPFHTMQNNAFLVFFHLLWSVMKTILDQGAILVTQCEFLSRNVLYLQM